MRNVFDPIDRCQLSAEEVKIVGNTLKKYTLEKLNLISSKPMVTREFHLQGIFTICIIRYNIDIYVGVSVWHPKEDKFDAQSGMMRSFIKAVKIMMVEKQLSKRCTAILDGGQQCTHSIPLKDIRNDPALEGYDIIDELFCRYHRGRRMRKKRIKKVYKNILDKKTLNKKIGKLKDITNELNKVSAPVLSDSK